MTDQSILSQQNKNIFLPHIDKPVLPKLNANTSLKRFGHNRQDNTSRSINQSTHSPKNKNEKVISHFLIRYLQRKEHFQQKSTTLKTVTNFGDDKKHDQNINTPFRRALLKRRHSPKKPLQTRFLIANYESIAFV